MNWIAIEPKAPAFNFAEYHNRGTVQVAENPAPARAHLPKGWEAQCRDEYECYVMYRYLAAEEAVSGYFLNDRGRAADVLDYNMFFRPWREVSCYAGEELLAWVAENGETMTYTVYRAQYRAGVEVMV